MRGVNRWWLIIKNVCYNLNGVHIIYFNAYNAHNTNVLGSVTLDGELKSGMNTNQEVMLSDIQLLGITYTEFDNKVGPQLKYAFPADVISKEAFEAYSDYVIVNKQLCEKLIVVNFDDIQFLNYSVGIDNTKYHRNALLFAFGFVLAKGANPEPYGAVLEKISSTFVNLEVLFINDNSS